MFWLILALKLRCIFRKWSKFWAEFSFSYQTPNSISGVSVGPNKTIIPPIESKFFPAMVVWRQTKQISESKIKYISQWYFEVFRTHICVLLSLRGSTQRLDNDDNSIWTKFYAPEYLSELLCGCEEIDLDDDDVNSFN